MRRVGESAEGGKVLDACGRALKSAGRFRKAQIDEFSVHRKVERVFESPFERPSR